MRAFRIPCFVLLLLLALSLANSSAMARHCVRWNHALDAAQQAVSEERWSDAGRSLDELQESWTACEVWLRIVLSHNTVDEAQQLMERSRLMVGLEEATHARDAMTELDNLLERIGGGEQLSLSNVL
jgi:hypothetical protein